MLHQRLSKKKMQGDALQAFLSTPLPHILRPGRPASRSIHEERQYRTHLYDVGAVVRALGSRDPALYNQHSGPHALHPTLYNLRSTVKYARMCVYKSTCEVASMYT